MEKLQKPKAKPTPRQPQSHSNHLQSAHPSSGKKEILPLDDTIKSWQARKNYQIKDKLKQTLKFIKKAEKLDIFGNIIEEKKNYYKQYYSQKIEEIEQIKFLNPNEKSMDNVIKNSKEVIMNQDALLKDLEKFETNITGFIGNFQTMENDVTSRIQQFLTEFGKNCSDQITICKEYLKEIQGDIEYQKGMRKMNNMKIQEAEILEIEFIKKIVGVSLKAESRNKEK